jgi:hypothetical protein
VITQGSAYDGLQSFDLQFDVKKSARAIAAQDTVELRQIRQLQAWSSRNGTAPMPGIMTNDRLPVGGETNVKLKTIAAVLERQIERGQGVFRN